MANTFYSYSVLSHQLGWQAYLRYGIILVGALFVGFYIIYYLRNRNVTKYRDLLVIIVLVVLLTIGIQIRDIQNNQSVSRNTAAITTLIKSIGRAKKVPVTDIYANSTTAYSGMLIQIGKDRDQIFEVTLNSDNHSYQLTKANLIDAKISYITQ